LETGIIPASEPLIRGFQFYPLTGAAVAGIVVIIVLLFLSALISGSEVAYFSLGPGDKQKLSGSRRDLKVQSNLRNPERLLATILVSNNFVNVGIVILGAFVTSMLFDFSTSPILEFIVQAVLITFLLLLFGEILPKVYATHYPLSFARFMAYPLDTLAHVFSPLNAILIQSTNFVNKRLRKRQKNDISMDQISQALVLTSENEISDEKEILEGIVKFGNKSVAEIMRPRVDVVSLDIRTGFSEVLDVIVQTGYSRLPVYSESFDHVKGILFIKDLLPYTEKGPDFIWQNLLRPPFYVPETRKIKALLEDFQKNKVHMAVVVDEYGGSSGIVTLEDVLEEIVGDIADEFDEDEHFYSRLGDNKFLFDGKTSLIDFCKVTDTDEEIFDDVKGDADTLAGLILELKGEFPVQNEKFRCKHFNFIIEAITKRRIKQIRVEVVSE
jgi:gliding motility-associated protein GldE